MIFFRKSKLIARLRESANRNAGLWAEAEARANIAETELSRLQAAHAMLQKCYEDMKGIAARALEAAHVTHFPEARHAARMPPRPDDAVGVQSHKCACGYNAVMFNQSPQTHCPKCSQPLRSPNFLAVNCLNCTATIQRGRDEFPLNCPICGKVVDPVLDAKELSE